VEDLLANLKTVELANFTGEQLVEVADATERGIRRVCRQQRLDWSFLAPTEICELYSWLGPAWLDGVRVGGGGRGGQVSACGGARGAGHEREQQGAAGDGGLQGSA
jgi:hypothetical protein